MSRQPVGIAWRNLSVVQERLRVSGVEVTSDPAYVPGAVVPTPATLHEPSRDELRRFLGTDATSPGGLVEIIQGTDGLSELIRDYSGTPLRPTDCLPNQLTTTVDAKRGGKFAGLHIDNGQGLPASKRLESNRRIGFNLGPGNRYLLIGSVDALDLADIYGTDPGYVPSTEDVMRYAADDKGQVAMLCAWILLRPNEGYIAPTQVVAHDGSTYGQPLGSLIHFYDGLWEPGSLGSII